MQSAHLAFMFVALLLFCAPCSCRGIRICSHGLDLSPCPIGWADLGDKICSAPSSYGGGCLNLVRMWDDEFKWDFGIVLDLSYFLSCVMLFSCSGSLRRGISMCGSLRREVRARSYSVVFFCLNVPIRCFSGALARRFVSLCSLIFPRLLVVLHVVQRIGSWWMEFAKRQGIAMQVIACIFGFAGSALNVCCRALPFVCGFAGVL